MKICIVMFREERLAVVVHFPRRVYREPRMNNIKTAKILSFNRDI